jgi:hypothetical protein
MPHAETRIKTIPSSRKLHLAGEKIVSPGAKRGLIPCVVPLSESPAGIDMLEIE